MRHPIIAAVAHDDEARDAVALAVDIARARQAPLLLAAVYFDGVGPGSKGYADVARPAAKAELAAIAAGLPEDLDISTRAIGSSSVVRGLHELAEQEDAATLVLGPTHTGRVGRHLTGDVTLGALHAAPCPIAVAPPGYAANAHPVKTVAVGYDDTAESRDALEAAVDIAQRNGARLRIVHVLGDPYAAMPFYDVNGPESDLQAMRDEALAWLEDAKAQVADRVAVDTVLLNGDPAEQLAQASADVDILIVGSRGFGPLRRVLLGSVSAGVVHQASCPVLVLARGAHVRTGEPVEA